MTSNSGEVLYRQAFGRQVQLGQQYNPIYDGLTEISLEGIEYYGSYTHYHEEFSCNIEDGSSNWLKALNTPTDQQLGLMIGLHDDNLMGYGNLIQWSKNCNRVIRAVAVFSVSTFSEYLRLDRLPEQRLLPPLVMTEDSYVVTEIHYGARMIFSFECYDIYEKDYDKTHFEIKNLVREMETSWRDLTHLKTTLRKYKHLKLRYEIHGDVPINWWANSYREIEDCVDFLLYLPRFIGASGNKGVPIAFSISNLFCYGPGALSHFPVLDLNVFERIEKHFQAVNSVFCKFKDFIEDSFAGVESKNQLSRCQLYEINQAMQDFDGKIAHQRRASQDLILNYRTKREFSQVVIAKFERLRSIFSEKHIISILSKYDVQLNSIKYLKELMSVNCTIVNSQKDLVALTYQIKDVYVLRFYPKSPGLFTSLEWKRNYSLFLDIAEMVRQEQLHSEMNTSIKIFVLEEDCPHFLTRLLRFTFPPPVAICHYWNGNIMSDDCAHIGDEHFQALFINNLTRKRFAERFHPSATGSSSMEQTSTRLLEVNNSTLPLDAFNRNRKTELTIRDSAHSMPGNYESHGIFHAPPRGDLPSFSSSSDNNMNQNRMCTCSGESIEVKNYEKEEPKALASGLQSAPDASALEDVVASMSVNDCPEEPSCRVFDDFQACTILDRSSEKTAEEEISGVGKSEICIDVVENDPNIDYVVLKFICPAFLYGKCQSKKEIVWHCEKCSNDLLYGFNAYIYCSNCGKSPALSFSFKCNHSTHGHDFFKLQKEDDLLGMLEKLKCREDMNILILGETGVGKSTFINAFANYLTYGTLEEAQTSKLISLIPTSFTLSDENYEDIKVSFGEDDPNEAGVTGSSKTQSCKSYSFPRGLKNIRLIDTPGIGDTRGIDQDAKNFLNILNFISNLPKIHGILLLMKPNNSRLSVFFKFCIQELLTQLHKNASENIVFVFTNAKSTFYRPGDTLPPLKKLLGQLEDIRIPLTQKTLYCLDNESFRFLVALGNNVKFTEFETAEYNISWNKSVVECQRLINHVAKLKPHSVKDTLSINEARRVIWALNKPLVDAIINIQENLFYVNRQIKIIEASDNRLEKLRDQMFIPEVVNQVVTLRNPKTVCQSFRCRGGDAGTLVVCHDPCRITVNAEIVNNEKIKKCAIFGGFDHCGKCGCSWMEHTQVVVDVIKIKVKQMDHSVESHMKNSALTKEKAEQTKTVLEDKISQYQKELDYIIKTSATFSHFLLKNALAHKKDVLVGYLEHAIEIEKSKQRLSNDPNAFASFGNSLEKVKHNYVLEIKKLQDVDQVVTLQEIDINVHMLYDLPLLGKFFKDMADHCERVLATDAALQLERVYVPRSGTDQGINFPKGD